MSDYNVNNFKIGACVITYKGSVLGATQGGVNVKLEVDTYDVKCDQSFNQPVQKIVTGVKLDISTSLMEIDSSFNMLLDESGQFSDSIIGSDLLSGKGELLLTPIGTGDSTGYKFPGAVLDPGFDYSFDVENNHAVEISFSATPDSNGVFMEKITV